MAELLKWARYSLPMKFSTGAGELQRREGIILEWRLPDGAPSWTEASPLSGWSRETLEDCERFLLGGSKSWHSAPSALRFAHEAAPFGRAGAESLPHPVKSQAVIPADQSMQLRLENSARFATLKLKVGPGNLASVVGHVKALRNSKKIRLDANGTVPLSVWKELPKDFFTALDYIEDPCPKAEAEEAIAWFKEAKVSLALDAKSPEEARRFWKSGGMVVVAKPMVWGGLQEVEMALTAAAAARGRLVVGSALETSVGRTILVRWLSGLGWTETMGLSTGFVFGGDSLPDFPVYSGELGFHPGAEPWWGSLRWQ